MIIENIWIDILKSYGNCDFDLCTGIFQKNSFVIKTLLFLCVHASGENELKFRQKARLIAPLDILEVRYGNI